MDDGMRWAIFAVVVAFFWSWSGQWRGRSRHGRHQIDEVARLHHSLAERDERLALMEARVSELENRLDFTERLLANHRDASLTGEKQRQG